MLAEGRQLSIGNLAMFFRLTIATDMTPKLDDMKRRYVARNTAQDICLNLLWRERHGSDLPPYPPSGVAARALTAPRGQ